MYLYTYPGTEYEYYLLNKDSQLNTSDCLEVYTCILDRFIIKNNMVYVKKR